MSMEKLEGLLKEISTEEREELLEKSAAIIEDYLKNATHEDKQDLTNNIIKKAKSMTSEEWDSLGK
ncbi:hypothetical protein [Gudongella sp. DL1XJH-153]|uniref:hypothetical protein n=1 Tax=Gudongella sp. DL1XJH-153 TaxID=3409804 RepID=UPI003BB7CE0D